MERLHNRDIKIHKCEMTPEIFAGLHASRLIGFLLKLEFSHFRREKCRNIKWKHYLSSNRFCLYSFKGLEGRNFLLDPRAEAEVCIDVLALFFLNWFNQRQIFNTSTPDTSDNSRWLYKDSRIQFTQFPSLNHKPLVDDRRLAKKTAFFTSFSSLDKFSAH